MKDTKMMTTMRLRKEKSSSSTGLMVVLQPLAWHLGEKQQETIGSKSNLPGLWCHVGNTHLAASSKLDGV
jgi:hypothetical protein